jgi:hypothetical protein
MLNKIPIIIGGCGRSCGHSQNTRLTKGSAGAANPSEPNIWKKAESFFYGEAQRRCDVHWAETRRNDVLKPRTRVESETVVKRIRRIVERAPMIRRAENDAGGIDGKRRLRERRGGRFPSRAGWSQGRGQY